MLLSVDKDLFSYKKIVGVDIETWDGKRGGSLDPFSGKIALVQMAFEDGDIRLYRPWDKDFKDVVEILEDKDTLKIGHNFKFDLKFFYVNGIFPYPVFDTMIASQIIYAGIGEPDDISEQLEALKKDLSTEDVPIFEISAKKKTKATRFLHSLQAVLKRELGVYIGKDVQNSNWGVEKLSDSQIEYAKNDVKYLINLAKVLWAKIKSANLERVAFLEMQFLEVLAMLELTGIKIDREGWKKKIELEEQELKKLESELKKEIYYKYVAPKNNELMSSLFEDDSTKYEKINLNSPLQMAKIFGLPNVSKTTLQKISDETIKKYIDYKKKAKLVTTYSEEYLNNLSSNNRLRSDYSQTKTATGRISSSSPNLQNVPSWFKKYIRAEEGYIPVFADYSQVELRILAYLSGDEGMIDSCNSKDMHSENARKIFKIPPDAPVPPELRKKAKTVSFAIPYGSSAFGLVERGMFSTLEEAEESINLFFEQFPKVREFLERNATSATKGITRDAIGRVRNYEVPYISSKEEESYQEMVEFFKDLGHSFSKLVRSFDHETILRVYNVDKEAFKYAISYLEKQSEISKIRREGQNHPIQATSASITKTAMVDLLKFLSLTGYGYMTLTVHDSIFFEIRKDYIFDALPKIKEIMEKAGEKVVPGIITPVDIEVGEKIEKVCSKCGQTKEINRYEVLLEERILIDYLKDDFICEECSVNP